MITIDSLIGQMKNLFAIKTPVRFDTPEYIQFHSDLIQYIYENHFEESDEWKIISRNLVYTSTQRMAVGEGNTILIQLDALKRRELGLRLRLTGSWFTRILFGWHGHCIKMAIILNLRAVPLSK